MLANISSKLKPIYADTFPGDFMYSQYKNEWLRKKRDRLTLVMPKGRKAELQALAKGQGKSLTKFINDAIDAYAGRK